MSKSALRVLEIMEHIASQRDGCTHTAIAQGLSIPKSSLTALLQDMLSKGYLQRNSDSGIFTIGVQVLWLANSYLRNLNLVKLGQPVVAELFAQVKQFSLLAIPTGGEYVVICTETVPSAFGHTLQVGSRGPLYCSAIGKAILANMPEDQVDAILRATPRVALTSTTKTTLREIREELEATRRSGIGRSRGEVIAGSDGFAAPVFAANGVPVAALGVGILSADVKEREVPRIEAALKKAAKALSRQLGWREAMAA
jgi:DNA-binding IclR family transcriptional regulator